MTMTMRSTAFVLLLPLVAAGVVQLNEDNFHAETAGKNVFIKFFAPWCGHCKKMAPGWEQLAKDFESMNSVVIADIDCTTDEGKPVCNDFEIASFPTLYYGDPATPEKYKGKRDYEALSEFAKEHLSIPYCSAYLQDECSDEEKKVIAELEVKSREELEELEVKAEEQLEEAQIVYDEGMEKIEKQYEEMAVTYNAKMDEIRHATQIKFVQQI